MHVGRSPTGPTALMVLATERPVPDEVLVVLRADDGILDLNRVSL